MAVFKRKRKTKLPSGKTVVRQSAKWHIKYRDADGIVRCVPASTDKVASQQLEAKLLKEVELAKVGIFNPHEHQQAKPLAEHLAEFKQSLLDKGGRTVPSTVISSVDGSALCGFRAACNECCGMR